MDRSRFLQSLAALLLCPSRVMSIRYLSQAQPAPLIGQEKELAGSTKTIYRYYPARPSSSPFGRLSHLLRRMPAPFARRRSRSLAARFRTHPVLPALPFL